MELIQKQRPLRRFLKQGFREIALWILAILIAAILFASLSSEIAIRVIQQVAPEAITWLTPPSGTVPKTIIIDPDGNPWVWTKAGVLLMYDGEQWDWVETINEQFVEDGAATFPNVCPHPMAFDEHGQAWIGVDHGLLIYDGEHVDQLDVELTTEYRDYVEPFTFGPSNIVWVGSSTELYAYDIETWQFDDFNTSVLTNVFFQAVSIDSQGRAWIGTSHGLTMIDGSNWETYTTDNSDLHYDYVTRVVIDSQDNIWVGTLSGLNVFNGQNWDLYHFKDPDSRENCIKGLFIDAEDKVWVFSSGGCYSIPDIYTRMVSVYDGQSWTSIDRINLSEIQYFGVAPIGRAWFLLKDNTIVATSLDLSDPSQLRQFRFFTLVYSLQMALVIKPLIGLAFIWVMIFATRVKSRYGLISLLISLFSVPILYFSGLTLEVEVFYIPIGNMMVLLFGIYLAVKGMQANDSKGLSVVAGVLNIAMLLLYFAQIYHLVAVINATMISGRCIW